jgi:hypothetical protein
MTKSIWEKWTIKVRTQLNCTSYKRGGELGIEWKNYSRSFARKGKRE